MANKSEQIKKPQVRTNAKKQQMLEALTKSSGIVYKACDEVGISRTTHYEWIKTDPDYAQAVEDLSEKALDFAEEQLQKHIEKMNLSAIIFFLKTQGKKRGYIERVEHEQKEVNQFSQYTDDELHDRLRTLRTKHANN